MASPPALTLRSKGPERRISRIVEIVGPPGAGKTSLLSALDAQGLGLRPVYGWRRLRLLPSFARDALDLSPFFLAARRAGQPLARRDLERMVRVQTSRRIAAQWREGIRVMDQGPIYTLGTLHLHRPYVAVSDPFEIWWNRMAQAWASLLDTVILLDAADEILLERISGRSKPHRLKADGADGSRSLAALRDTLDRTVESIRVHSELSLLRIDTGRDGLARVVDRVRAELDREPGRGGTRTLQARAAAPAAAADCR